ncbi:transglutaminase family protein [Erythrobacter sp. THAF29]|uniref:transglutaminase-like domain-containing protein n=1 Tax=Erythrobacter sp. THAF29 TaxID=2587851 RepID=UPI001267BF59|nr:transglutaminase family protein [Erythrobacter sp. THAF29]QFT76905.1 Transglutaminase-like superfamily protein [Erythrobacter sp. THAF29]
MPIRIDASFAFELDQPTDVLLQFEAAPLPEQSILSADTRIGKTMHQARVAAQDGIGERIWLRGEGRFDIEYTALVDVNRQTVDLPTVPALEPHLLPGEAVQYLLDSRFCPADRFQSFVQSEFGGTTGGARVEAIRAWIAHHLSYVPGASGPHTDASDTFIGRQGICRDYAHLLVTLARASTIPARYVACYAPGVDPPDFHAVAEVFLADPEHEDGGTWQIVDATGMADPVKTVKIGVGRDAADVSFLTSFGPNRFISSNVGVSEA